MHSTPIQVLRFEKQTAYDLLWPIAWQIYGIQMEQDWGFYLWFTYTLNGKQQAKPRVKNWPKEEHVQFCGMVDLKGKLISTERLSWKT